MWNEELANRLKEEYALLLQHPSESEKYRIALNKFLFYCQKLPGLLQSKHGDYLEALNKTWLYVARNITVFQPTENDFVRSLTNWINGYLIWRIRELYYGGNQNQVEMFINEGQQEVDWLDSLNQKNFNPPSLSDLDRLEKEEENQAIARFIDYINLDPQNRLQRCHPKDYPQVNCQLLTQRLFLNEPVNTFQQLREEFQINYQTLHSHWRRNCLPLLKEIFQDYLVD